MNRSLRQCKGFRVLVRDRWRQLHFRARGTGPGRRPPADVTMTSFPGNWEPTNRCVWLMNMIAEQATPAQQPADQQDLGIEAVSVLMSRVRSKGGNDDDRMALLS